MSLTADLPDFAVEVGGQWWPIATFQIGSARRFRQALHGAGLADRGLPPDVSEVLRLRDRYDEQVTAHPQVQEAIGRETCEMVQQIYQNIRKGK